MYFMLEIRSRLFKKKKRQFPFVNNSPLTFAPVIPQESRCHCSFLQLVSPAGRNICLLWCKGLTADTSATTKDFKSSSSVSMTALYNCCREMDTRKAGRGEKKDELHQHQISDRWTASRYHIHSL